MADTVLGKMDPKTLTAIVKERNLIAVDMQSKTLPEEYKSRYYSRETCLGLIKKDLTKQCIIQFSQNLSAKELKSWTKGIQKSVLSSKKMNNPNHASVMKKRLKEQLEQDGLKKYIKSVDPSRKLLQATLKTLAMETECADREELVALLNKQLKLMALEAVLVELSPKLLQQMILDSELNIKSTSKPTIVHHLVEMKDYTPAPRKMPVRPKLPARPVKAKKPGNEDKENRAPNRRTKLENIEIEFTSDDSEEFNRKSVVEHDCSIEEKDDADRHPLVVSDSESFYDDTSSDPDFKDSQRKKSRRKKHRSHRSKRRHHRSHKKRDDYADTDEDDSKVKHRKRKHAKHSDDEAEEKPQRKKTKSDEDEKNDKPKINEKDGSEDKTKEKPSEEKSPTEEVHKKTKLGDEEHKKSDTKIPKSGKRKPDSSEEEDNSPPKKIDKIKASEENPKKPEKPKEQPDSKTRPETHKKTSADLIDEEPAPKKDKGKEESVPKKPKHKDDSENTKKPEEDEPPKKHQKEDLKKQDTAKTRPESTRKTASLDESLEDSIDKKKIEKEKSKITPKDKEILKDKEIPKDKHKREDSDDRTKKSKKKY